MATSSEKLARELRGPGLVEIIFSVVLSLLLGVVLGAAHLVFKPVEKKTEKELASAQPAMASLLYRSVQFVEGTNAGGADWRTKQQAFVSGTPGGITFSEGELNTLIATLVPPPKPAAPPAPEPSKP